MRITQKTSLAVSLIVEGLPYKEVAQRCGISLPCLSKWRTKPEFQALLHEAKKRIEAELFTVGIANPVARQKARNQRWIGAQQVIEIRKSDPRYQKEPGGETGLLRMDVRTINGKPVGIYKVDKPLLSEMRAMEDSAARDVPPPAAIPDTFGQDAAEADYSLLSDEELETLRRIAHKLAADKEAA